MTILLAQAFAFASMYQNLYLLATISASVPLFVLEYQDMLVLRRSPCILGLPVSYPR